VAGVSRLSRRSRNPGRSRRPPPDELQELIGRVYRTRRTRARVIIERSLRILPHYRAVPAARLAVVRRSVLHHLTLFYHVTLATGRRLTDADLAASRQTARRRAAEGVPLGEFLTFFQIGLAVIWEHLMASAGGSPTLRDRLLDRVGAIISNQTQLMTALVEAYVDERERLSRFREQNLDDFFQLLLGGEAPDDVLEARAESLGVALHEPHAIAIFGPSAADGADGADAMPDEIRRGLDARARGAAVWLGRSREGLVALLPTRPDAEAPAMSAGRLAGDRHVGVGSPGSGVEGLRRSAREGLRALRIGMALRRPERVHGYDDVAILDLVQVGSPGSEEFVQRVLGPLMKAGARNRYLETLRQFLAHAQRIKLASAALAIHPHTLSYRLKQIRRRFGIDLDAPDVRLRVHLALQILDARGAAAGGRRPRRRSAAQRPA
jgi:sugar diacid utilization regulator